MKPSECAQDLVELSIVIPCLNEGKTIGRCIEEVKAHLNEECLEKTNYEIIVADNGSTDRSREIALKAGARVVDVITKGYGAAILHGMAAASGDYVVYADGDGTYPLCQSYELYAFTKSHHADIGIGGRIGGTIEKGAMPWLHRWIGTPGLGSALVLLHGVRVVDCTSGFRCVRRNKIKEWRPRSPGMEFSLELLVKASKCGGKIVETPFGLRRSLIERNPHLRTWHDGIRLLMFLILEKPRMLTKVGLISMILPTIIQIGILNFKSSSLSLIAATASLVAAFLGMVIFLAGNALDLWNDDSNVWASVANRYQPCLWLIGGLWCLTIAILAAMVSFESVDFGHLNVVACFHLVTLPAQLVCSLVLIQLMALHSITQKNDVFRK